MIVLAVLYDNTLMPCYKSLLTAERASKDEICRISRDVIFRNIFCNIGLYSLSVVLIIAIIPTSVVFANCYRGFNQSLHQFSFLPGVLSDFIPAPSLARWASFLRRPVQQKCHLEPQSVWPHVDPWCLHSEPESWNFPHHHCAKPNAPFISWWDNFVQSEVIIHFL